MIVPNGSAAINEAVTFNDQAVTFPVAEIAINIFPIGRYSSWLPNTLSGAPDVTIEDTDTLVARLDRLESVEEIRQLAARYAVAVDGRDIDSWVALFIEDVNCGRHGTGRKVLHDIISAQLRGFYRSVHFVGNHQIDLIDANHATGIAYCKAEHEVGDKWIVMPVAYFDEYERRGGRWYFVRRRERHWYSVDHLDRPSPPFHRWPDPDGTARLPGDFPTWCSFWAESSPLEVALVTTDPIKATGP